MRRRRRRGRGRGRPPRGDRARARRGAAPGDTVVIAGKGHEQGQEFERRAQDPVRRPRGRARGAARAARRRGARVIELAPERIAAEAGAEIVARGRRRAARARGDRLARGRRRATSSSACAGERADGGEYAGRGARGRGVGRGRRARARAGALAAGAAPGWVFAAADPLAALQALARAWRRELGCPRRRDHRLDRQDLGQGHLRGRCCRGRVHASPENFNTEIGLPLAILAAPPETEVLVLEMAMRGLGQIAELCAIAEPDVARDHQRRPGPPRAARDARGDRRGEGGDPRRPRPTTAAPSSRPTPRRSSRTSHDALETITFGPGGDVFARDARASRATGPRRRSSPRSARPSSSFRSPRRTTSPTRSARSRSASRSARRRPRWRVGRRAYPSRGCGAS